MTFGSRATIEVRTFLVASERRLGVSALRPIARPVVFVRRMTVCVADSAIMIMNGMFAGWTRAGLR